MAGGPKPVDKLRGSKIDAKASSGVKVPLDQIWFPPKGHKLWHPRSDFQPREDMVQETLDRVRRKLTPIRLAVVVRDDGEDQKTGQRRLLIVNGSQRTINGLEAQRRMRADGSAPEDYRMYVDVEFFDGTDEEVILERLRLNDDPLQLLDSPSVLSDSILQLRVFEVSDERIAARLPRHAQRSDIEPLTRFRNLVPEVQRAFDHGVKVGDVVHPVPIGLLSAVLDAQRETQMDTLVALIEAGISTRAGASRKRNRDRAERARERGEDAVRQRPYPNVLRRVVGAVERLAETSEESEREMLDHVVEQAVLQADVQDHEGVARAAASIAISEGRVSAMAEGFCLATRYALGLVSLADLPVELREVAEKSLVSLDRKPSERKPRAERVPRPPRDWASLTEQVIAALDAAGTKGLKMEDITAATSAKPGHCRKVLKDLMGSKRVRHNGEEKRARRYFAT
jgi:hypothetical protein